MLGDGGELVALSAAQPPHGAGRLVQPRHHLLVARPPEAAFCTFFFSNSVRRLCRSRCSSAISSEVIMWRFQGRSTLSHRRSNCYIVFSTSIFLGLCPPRSGPSAPAWWQIPRTSAEIKRRCGNEKMLRGLLSDHVHYKSDMLVMFYELLSLNA